MPDPLRLLALFATGTAAGVVGSVVSLASLVSYPALLALGMSPLTANVTNTAALTFAGIGSVLRSRGELVGLGATTVKLAPMSAVGGVLGAAILLTASERSFELVVPVLVGAASLAIVVQPKLLAYQWFQPRGLTPATMLGVLAVATYTGYFGAAGGVLLMVALGWVLDVSVVRRNAVKNALAAVANGVAAIAVLIFGPVEFGAVPPLAVGFLVGGLIGPSVSRRLGDDRLRWSIFGSGLVVAAVLAWRTYR
ncbi:MAG: sulfite exporter TauE/SafE family protein [Kineosporiaceae bacterium]|nr:sulfite exporter TauE/SafE family protein [Kineosporiaceae bacterium]